MSIKLIVDSACDMSEKLIHKYNIDILPFNVNINDKTYLDNYEIDTEDVYESMKNGTIPTTSQVSPKSFEKTFTREAEKGNRCIYISFSSKMSGAYQTANIVANQVKKKYSDFSIDIIDSKSGSMAIGIMAMKAGEMIEKGKSVTKIIETIKFYAEHIEHFFTLDNLKYLQHGGRISKTKSIIGNILNIKPILTVENGTVKLLRKVRGTKKSLKNIFKQFKEKTYNIKEQTVGISHAGDREKAKELESMITENFGDIDLHITSIGSVLGVHLGIGGVGIFFLNKAYD